MSAKNIICNSLIVTYFLFGLMSLGAACHQTSGANPSKGSNAPTTNSPLVANAIPDTPTPPAPANEEHPLVTHPPHPPTKVYSKAELLGQFDPANHSDFVPVLAPYTDKTGMMLRKEAYESFVAMWKEAKSAGITLKIISSTRNFDYQKGIWERKWNNFATKHPNPQDRAVKILEFSSMPGTSRHHWGTDLDLNALDNGDFELGKPLEPVYKWLVANAGKHGFCQVYSSKGSVRPNGYNEEKWHWSYMPLSSKMLQSYRESVELDDIKGFNGSSEAVGIDVIRNYVFGINKECH